MGSTDILSECLDRELACFTPFSLQRRLRCRIRPHFFLQGEQNMDGDDKTCDATADCNSAGRVENRETREIAQKP